MVVWVVEFSSDGYKIKKKIAQESTYSQVSIKPASLLNSTEYC